MQAYFLTNILLAIVWVLLTGDIDGANFVFGFILGFLIVWMISLRNKDTRYVKFIPKIIVFLAYFFYQLIKANLEVAYEVGTPHHNMRPGIVAVPLDISTDFEITVLTSVIALTPGSLCIDVSDDKKTLYVHAMNIANKEEYVKKIKNGFERRLLNITRG